MIVMTKNHMNPKTQSNPIFGTVRTLLGQRQPRWLVLVTSGLALLILCKIALVASQIFDIMNATYAASLT